MISTRIAYARDARSTVMAGRTTGRAATSMTRAAGYAGAAILVTVARLSSSGADQPQPGEPARAAPQGAAAWKPWTVGAAFLGVVGLSVAVWVGLTVLWVVAVAIDDHEGPLTERLGTDGTLTVLVLIVVLTILAPLQEEFLFRGYVFRALRNRQRLWPAAVTTGVLSPRRTSDGCRSLSWSRSSSSASRCVVRRHPIPECALVVPKPVGRSPN